MPYGENKIAMGVWLRIGIALMMIISTPFSALSAQLINTIQIGSHLSEQRARRQFKAVLALLEEQEKSYLRIEHLDNYYALRLGKFATPEEAKDLYTKINSFYPDAQLMKAYVSHNRLVEMYGAAAAEKPVVPPVEQDKKPATIPAEQQEVSRQIASEEAVPPPLDQNQEPAIIPEEKPDVPQQIVSEKPVPAAIKPNLEPAKGPGKNPEVEAPVAVKDSTAEVAARVKSPPANVAVAGPAKSLVPGEMAAPPTDPPTGLLSLRNFIIMVAALTLIMLVCLVRSLRRLAKPQPRRATLIAEQPAESPEHIASPGAEQNAPVYARQREIADPDQKQSPPSQNAVEVDSDFKVAEAEPPENFPREDVAAVEMVAKKSIEAAAPVDVAPIEPEPLAADHPVADTPDSKGAESVQKDKENRLTRAMEAVTLGKTQR